MKAQTTRRPLSGHNFGLDRTGARRVSRTVTRLGRGLVLAGLVTLGLWALAVGVQLSARVRSMQSHIQHLEGLLEGGVDGPDSAELRGVGGHLGGLHEDLQAIQLWVGPLLPMGKLLSWLPTYGGDLAAADPLLDRALSITSAGERLFRALAPALDLVAVEKGEGHPASLGTRLLPVLIAAQPELWAARQDLAALERAQIDVSSLSPRASRLADRLDGYLPWLETAIDGLLLAPGLLGAESCGGPQEALLPPLSGWCQVCGVDGARTYLVIAQNNQEIRATGGFISGVGEVRIENGQLAFLGFQDSNAVDNLAVPHELTPTDFQRVLQGQLWFFRDSNWDPDFPTSAQRALDLYARDQGVRAEGVIALDLPALRLLVEAIAPLHVEGIDEPVTGQNVLDLVQTQWGEPAAGNEHEWWFHRKDFMGQISGAAVDRLLTDSDLQPVGLLRATLKALSEKHILIYMTDPQAASLLRDRNWDGALVVPDLPSDSLMVVDSNVGFNKVDARIDRFIDYQVDLAAEKGPRARLTLTYRHRSARPVGACVQESRYGDNYADMIDRCYWNYVRIYAPAGSRLLSGPDLPLPPGSLLARSGDPLPSPAISPTLAQDGWAVWTAFFDLPTLEERTLAFDYELPLGVLEHSPDGLIHYRLRIQKQPGTEALPLRVGITLPPGAELVRAVPIDLPQVETDLRVDREFEIVFRYREGGP